MVNKRNDAILKPWSFKGFKRKRVIYFPVDSPSQFLLNTLKRKAIKETKNMGYGMFFLLKDKVILYQSIGAPAAVLSLEGLIASGAKEIILLGFSGSLNPEFQIGSVVSISKAFSEEGTSRHYFPRKRYFKPSDTLKNVVEKIIYSHSLSFLEGSIVSTDAPFRETKSWLKKNQKKRIGLVDMETSAVFALAEFRGVESAALTIVSDEIWSGKWKKDFSSSLEEKMAEYFLPFI